MTDQATTPVKADFSLPERLRPVGQYYRFWILGFDVIVLALSIFGFILGFGSAVLMTYNLIAAVWAIIVFYGTVRVKLPYIRLNLALFLYYLLCQIGLTIWYFVQKETSYGLIQTTFALTALLALMVNFYYLELLTRASPAGAGPEMIVVVPSDSAAASDSAGTAGNAA
jgi:hypothetical protein